MKKRKKITYGRDLDPEQIWAEYRKQADEDTVAAVSASSMSPGIKDYVNGVKTLS